MSNIFNGRELRDQMLLGIKSQVQNLNFVPEFADVVVKDNLVSEKYAKVKARYAQMVGITPVDAFMEHNASTQDILDKIVELAARPNMCGIIVQLPLPDTIDTHAVLASIPYSLDVDGISPAYENIFYNSNNIETNIMPTAATVLKIIEGYITKIQNPKIVLLGYGKLVGRPVFRILKNLGYTPDVIDKDTDSNTKSMLLAHADIIISAAGVPNIVKADMIKDGVVIVDAGTSEDGGSIVGDVSSDAYEKALMYTPSPGGVGPVTVACLIHNVMLVANSKNVNNNLS
jgi:methylenetetrahydrofolate dehydrogenase (NADP+)/methenyltetrahydrofolate cyclohydrolase